MEEMTPLERLQAQARSGKRFSAWGGISPAPLAPPPGMEGTPSAQPMRPEDQSTEASRAQALAAHQATIRQGEAAKAAEEAAYIAQLKQAALTDPKAARELQLMGIE